MPGLANNPGYRSAATSNSGCSRGSTIQNVITAPSDVMADVATKTTVKPSWVGSVSQPTSGELSKGMVMQSLRVLMYWAWFVRSVSSRT
jgi:hypothetical protein